MLQNAIISIDSVSRQTQALIRLCVQAEDHRLALAYVVHACDEDHRLVLAYVAHACDEDHRLVLADVAHACGEVLSVHVMRT